MTAPFAPALDAGTDPCSEATRQLARSRVDGLRAQCRALCAYLAGDGAVFDSGGWRGVANAMYRARLAKLRGRLPGVLAAVEAADRALDAP